MRLPFALGLALIGALVSLVFMTGVPLYGDERGYSHAASALAGFVTGRVHQDEVIRRLVGYGWFIPGMPLVLAPLYVIVPEPSVGVVRSHACAFNLLLALWSLREFRRVFGAGSLEILVFPVLRKIRP